MNQERLHILFDKHLEGNISSSEREELYEMVQTTNAEEIESILIQQLQRQPDALSSLTLVEAQAAVDQLLSVDKRVPRSSIHRIPFLKTTWFRNAAAAILILLIGSVVYLWKIQKPTSILVKTNPAPMQNDVAAPSRNRATLTLSGNEEIFLDSMGNGMLATQGNVHIQKMNDGHIRYSGKSEPGPMQYNTLTVPRGSQVASIVLTDGSIVFLNAASSITYPVAFTGNERRVAITGEVYFEVSKDPNRKFIVTEGSITTEVLGTHFNINTYDEEGTTKVTLLEGKVKVISSGSNVIIKPGAQAAFAKGVLQVNPSVDVEQVIAWKNGLFNFNGADLPTVMRQLERWYDITVKYESNIKKRKFRGELHRNLTLQQITNILKEMDVKFRLENKTLFVQ